jgi:hypothetical protein
LPVCGIGPNKAKWLRSLPIECGMAFSQATAELPGAMTAPPLLASPANLIKQ